jgi:hypothetical protein
MVALAIATLAPAASEAQAPLAETASAIPRPAFASDACDSSYGRGAAAAHRTHSTRGYRAGGFASGVLFSLVGVAGVTVVASTVSAAPDTVPEREVSTCYRDGYRTTARARSRGTALRSGLLGAAILPVVYLVRLSNR